VIRQIDTLPPVERELAEARASFPLKSQKDCDSWIGEDSNRCQAAAGVVAGQRLRLGWEGQAPPSVRNLVRAGHHRQCVLDPPQRAPSGTDGNVAPAERPQWTPSRVGAAAVPGGAATRDGVIVGNCKSAVCADRWARRCGAPISAHYRPAADPDHRPLGGAWRRILGPAQLLDGVQPPIAYYRDFCRLRQRARWETASVADHTVARPPAAPNRNAAGMSSPLAW